MARARTPIEVFQGERPLEWRELWLDVLAKTKAGRDAIPMHALCWALEQLCRSGFERPRVVLFVQVIWQRFGKVIGPVPPRAPEPPSPTDQAPPVGASRRELEQFERELEAEIERAQKEQAAAADAYTEFCAQVNEARDRFGDARTWTVNVLGWALEVLYRRGYSDSELGALVLETWDVMVETIALEARAARDVSRGSTPPDVKRGIAQFREMIRNRRAR